VKLCLVSDFPDIIKDCPEIINLPKIYLRSFENAKFSLRRTYSWNISHQAYDSRPSRHALGDPSLVTGRVSAVESKEHRRPCHTLDSDGV